jgi:hypothetical protein
MVLHGPQLILAGEAGDEAVLPLTRRADMITTIRNSGAATSVASAAIAAGGRVGGGSVSLVQNIYPSAGMDEERLADVAARKAVTVIVDQQRRLAASAGSSR